ncbi:ArsR/SmtB family transcription factor [Rhizobium ruizarguesonis]
MVTAITDEDVERIAAALAAPRRLEIIKEIGAAIPYRASADIVRSQEITAATVSHHLRELERAQLIEISRSGKFLHVTPRRDVLAAYADYLLAI